MDQGFLAWLDAQQGRQYELHERHINPAFVKMIRTIGFDRKYARGEGSWLYDAEGQRYLDLLTGWGVFALGRNHPRVRSILEQVLSRDMPNLVRMDCSLLSGLVAERLSRLACTYSGGNLTRVFFCNSGTESVEAAIKFARCYTRKTRILFCDHAFHGLTVGSLSLNGSDFFRERFGNLMPDTTKVPVQRFAGARTGAARGRCRGIDRGAGTGQDLRSSRRRIPGGSGAAMPQSGRAAGSRRGAIRPGAHRQMVRLPALAGSGARYRLRLQGAFGWLRAGGRGDRHAAHHGLPCSTAWSIA